MAYHLLLAWLASSSLFLQKLSLSLIEEDSGVLLFLQKFEFNFCILCFNTTGEVVYSETNLYSLKSFRCSKFVCVKTV